MNDVVYKYTLLCCDIVTAEVESSSTGNARGYTDESIPDAVSD